MQDTYDRTINTLQSLRAISEHPLHSGETTPKAHTPAPDRTDDAGEQAEIWARRAAHGNGFGGM